MVPVGEAKHLPGRIEFTGFIIGMTYRSTTWRELGKLFL